MGKEKVFDGGLKESGDVVFGIDQSLTGYAMTALADDGTYCTWVYESSFKGADRLYDIVGWAQDTIDRDWGADRSIYDVAMEGYAYGSQMANALGEIGGVTKLLWRGLGFYPLIIAPTTLKKFATGKGTGVSKSLILKEVYKNWGVDFTDDNAADSYVLARIVHHFHLGGRVTKAQDEVITKLKKEGSRA